MIVHTAEHRTTHYTRDSGFTAFAQALARLLKQHNIVVRGAAAGPIRMAAGKDRPGAHPAVEKARTFIRGHFSERIDLDRLAEVGQLSGYHLQRLFVQEEGLSPRAYLENVRIEKARELLEQGESLAQTALQTGFYDQSHFANTFRKSTGLTPGEYRKIFQDRPN